MKNIEIDLGKYPLPSYIGRKNGQLLREKLNLDALSIDDNKVTLKIPEETRSVNSSFFLGLFGRDVKRCGSESKFYTYLNIQNVPLRFHEKIRKSVERALISNE